MKVVVHGGAGGEPERPERRQAVLDRAADVGAGADDPLTAVVSAVCPLEASEWFNAGVGSAVQSDGRIRTEAGVMTGDRSVGAAAGLRGVEHAVSAARVVLEETPHVLIAGQNAVALAGEHGVETGVDLWTDRTRERWQSLDKPGRDTPQSHLDWVTEQFGAADGVPVGDTVGAVARHDGDFAAATSTGGRWCAFAGRVGDVPQVGSGFYCSSAGAVSATGAGEQIARVNLAGEVVGHMESGHDPRMATRLAMQTFEESAPEDAAVGLIVVGEDDHRIEYDSDAMQTAVATD